MAVNLTIASQVARGKGAARRGSALASSTTRSNPPPPAPDSLLPIPTLPPIVIPAAFVPVVDPPSPLPPPEPVGLPAVKEAETIALEVNELRDVGLAMVAELTALRDKEIAESVAHPDLATANAAELAAIERLIALAERVSAHKGAKG